MNKLLVALCGVLAWCAVGRGEGDPAPGTIRAARFELVDSEGRPRAVIGIAEGAVHLLLLDGKGREGIGLLVSDDGLANLSLASVKGGNELSLSCDEHMASLLVGVIGFSTSIQSSRERGQSLVMTENSVARVALTVSPDEPEGTSRAGVSIRGAEGEKLFGAPR